MKSIIQEEVWKDIKNYERLYQISNLGRIKSLPRRGTIRQEKILKIYSDKSGYLYCSLSRNNKKKKYKVHRLVAEAFIQNPNNLPQINHKDENKKNNKIDNLEWCTIKHNLMYGSRLKKIRKKVIAINKNNEKFKFESIKEASEILNIDASSISKCCNKKRKKVGDYFLYYDEEI